MNGGWRPMAAAFALACCFTYGAYQTGRAFLHPNQGIDLAPNYTAANLARTGEISAVYDEQAVARRGHELGLHGSKGEEDPITRYGYPPWLLLVYAPLSGLPWRGARWVWFVIALAASLSAAWLMGRTVAGVPDQRRAWGLVGVAAAGVYFPITYGLMGGQANDLPFLGIVACLALLRADRPFLAGLVLAPAGMWKIFTGIPVLFLLARREWRALAGVATGVAGLVLLSLPWVGIDGWADWFHLMRQSYSTAVSVPRNHSIAAGMQALFSQSLTGRPLIDAPWLASALTAALQLLSVGAAVFAMAPPARRDEPRYALQFAITLVLAVLLVPMSWEHYGVFLLPAFLVCAAMAMETAPAPMPAAALGAAFGVWAFTLQLGSEYASLTGRLYALLAPVKLYATLLLLTLCVWLAGRTGFRGSPRSAR